MNIRIHTPEGTRDRMFSECLERRRVQAALVELFQRRGYTEVITPEVEYYDLFVQSGNPIPQEAMLKSIDRSGQILVFRPDCTAPIARVAATKLRSLALPQRLYYDQTVFRDRNFHEGGSREIAQCGVEMIGGAGEKADLEIIAMAADALKCCGLQQSHIELGHAGLFRAMASKLEMTPEEQEQLRTAVENKNFAQLNDILEPYRDRPGWEALHRLPYLFGGKEVLEEAEALAGEIPCLQYLDKLYAELTAAGYGDQIRFDLGMVHQLDYYTGLIFRGYAQGAAGAVLSGGRYDNLLQQFGRAAEATGFAVDVDAVGACLPVEAVPLDTVVFYGPGGLAKALQVVDSSTPGSCELSPCRTLESTIRMAQEKGARRILDLSGEKERWINV